MNSGISFGSRFISCSLSSGFGFYIESLAPSLRPALLDDGRKYLIEYWGTAIKLPFIVIEIGSFEPLMDLNDLEAIVDELTDED